MADLSSVSSLVIPPDPEQFLVPPALRGYTQTDAVYSDVDPNSLNQDRYEVAILARPTAVKDRQNQWIASLRNAGIRVEQVVQFAFKGNTLNFIAVRGQKGIYLVPFPRREDHEFGNFYRLAIGTPSKDEDFASLRTAAGVKKFMEEGYQVSLVWERGEGKAPEKTGTASSASLDLAPAASAPGTGVPGDPFSTLGGGLDWFSKLSSPRPSGRRYALTEQVQEKNGSWVASVEIVLPYEEQTPAQTKLSLLGVVQSIADFQRAPSPLQLFSDDSAAFRTITGKSPKGYALATSAELADFYRRQIAVDGNAWDAAAWSGDKPYLVDYRFQAADFPTLPSGSAQDLPGWNEALIVTTPPSGRLSAQNTWKTPAKIDPGWQVASDPDQVAAFARQEHLSGADNMGRTAMDKVVYVPAQGETAGYFLALDNPMNNGGTHCDPEKISRAGRVPDVETWDDDMRLAVFYPWGAESFYTCDGALYMGGQDFEPSPSLIAFHDRLKELVAAEEVGGSQASRLVQAANGTWQLESFQVGEQMDALNGDIRWDLWTDEWFLTRKVGWPLLEVFGALVALNFASKRPWTDLWDVIRGFFGRGPKGPTGGAGLLSGDHQEGLSSLLSLAAVLAAASRQAPPASEEAPAPEDHTPAPDSSPKELSWWEDFRVPDLSLEPETVDTLGTVAKWGVGLGVLAGATALALSAPAWAPAVAVAGVVGFVAYEGMALSGEDTAA